MTEITGGGAAALKPTEIAGNDAAAVGSERAPFIYFDGVAACGTQNGVTQIELVAHTSVALSTGGTRNELVVTAHLRTSMAGAAHLLRLLNQALAMLQPPADAKPN